MRERLDAVIVGGGASGLCTAHFLGQLSSGSAKFLLVEGAPALGGTIGTDELEGFVIDRGPDSFVAQKPQAKALCEEIGLGSEIIAPNEAARRVFVRRGGKLLQMPDGMILGVPTSVLSFLRSDFVSFGAKLRMGLDLVLPRGRDEEESIAAFVRRRFGAEAVEAIAEPLMAGIHSGRAEELSIDATFPMFRAMEKKHRSLILGLRSMAKSRSGGTPFLALRRGMGSLIERLAERVGAERTRTGAPVVALDRSGETYRVTLESGEILETGAVVLAVKSHHAASLLRPLSPTLAEALEEIRFASSAVVFFSFRREQVGHPLEAFGFVSAPGEGRVSAGTFVSTKFPGRAPPGQVLLRAFLGGAKDPEVLELDDDALRDVALAELRAVLSIRGEPGFTRIYRYRGGTPQLTLGHASRVAKLRELEASLPGLHLAAAGYEGTGIPECVDQGRRAAERILGGLGSIGEASSS